MKCFHFSNANKKDETHSTKSASGMSNSNSTASTDHDMRRSGSELSSQNVSDMKRSGSEFNSQNVSDISFESERRSQYPSFSQRPSNLRVFTFSELRVATKNFSCSLMIGEGGFGCVYRGTIISSHNTNTKIEVAVKQLNRRGLQGHKQWLTEVNVLGIVEHPNLVKLVGYCAEDDERGIQRLLIYEYMPNRSVLDHLSPRSTTPLSWTMRLRIALDAARGLTYLHEQLDFQIIFRDFKTSNILLDEQWNAKLSDFGLARKGPEEGLTHVSTAVVGTIGYAAPEYMQTGHLTAKSDIWSYGIVLYELITGRPPIDRNRPKGEQKLLEWIRPYISDAKKFRMILDTRLDDREALKSAVTLSTIANKCLVGRPRLRPKMSEVLEMVQSIVDSVEIGNPQPTLKIHTPQEAPPEEAKKRGLDLKRRICQLRMGEGRQLVWRGWTPKLVKVS